LHKEHNISDAIKIKSKELGFSGCGIIPADYLAEEEEHFKTWLDKNMHGEMGYMARNTEKRLDPRLLLENAKSLIIVLQNYFPQNTQTDSEAPVLSKYAYGTDYHFVIKDKLNKLLNHIREINGPFNSRPFTDSAPVLERAWARRAGLGWIGKNSNLISVIYGSFFFIGEILLDIELPYDSPKVVSDHCGSCTRCIDACPTKAIVDNRIVDARKCISYQTIELKGDIDESLSEKFSDRVFGCDICQDVCPWNLKSTPHNEALFEPHPKLMELSRNDWFNMEKSTFNEFFKNSAVKRAGFHGLKRNLEFISDQKKK
jgi:epoxyqueuosine reductase